MCGINGILRLAESSPAIDRRELLATREAMTARGPDGAGEWLSADGRVGLASRRLAILDLSPAGAQPMTSPDGRYVIVQNGEIYNFRQLRGELEREGVAFRSQSDTEVLLVLYARLGTSMLPRLRGMYALAIWDDAAGRLVLARDPLGIKPLYYSTEGGCLRFASQVKALEQGGALSRKIDPSGLAGFLLWGSVPEPLTIRRAIRAVPAGCFLAVENGRVEEPMRHYRFDPAPERTEEVDAGQAIADSVAAHLISDVPVAVFLSAGLDSGLVAALACRALPSPPTTFTLSFDVLAGTAADEASLAAEVARKLGTRHLERRVGKQDFLDLWPQAVAAMDQPSIDGFNTYVVSRAAHETGLKVVLSGLGGDELFGSYPSFTDVPKTWRMARWGGHAPGLRAAWPALAGRLLGGRPKLRGLLRHGGSLAGSYFLRRALFLPEELPELLGEEQAAAALAGYDPIADTAKVLCGGGGEEAIDGHRRPDPWLAVHLMESAQYLRNQLLRDSDWASMAHSVELRVPFVDARLRASLAAGGFDPARGQGKAALVRRIAPELPAELFTRPKSGFYIPVVDWMRPAAATAGNLGARSRLLARLVLEEFGVNLRSAAAA
ncbi:MAG TPA: asparagine synthase (glutamine-hydrolyzing) [Thermoanaerobaculia bacterium]|nr:asparagine synthase (glutamine-hydrolyzing) [Thermoanaerobaculia bacterium]